MKNITNKKQCFSDFVIAVHSLVYLAHKKTFISSKELSENVNANAVRIRSVLSLFIKQKWIEVQKGQNGGYKLLVSSENITVDLVLKIMDLDLINYSWSSGNMELECKISKNISQYMHSLVYLLNQNAMQLLSTVTISSIEKKLTTK
ncbi:Rrf2 family transcriptional regulator [Mycoplasma buteonis]|uniref:Rrf2 family transcriptional regulator n=1 Tax=Mycoplasma buteonis TaxID=171280 RepID=UPI0005685CF7|nr:Rrf2 family transcriptional regulator [Mycoplasma buteonis]